MRDELMFHPRRVRARGLSHPALERRLAWVMSAFFLVLALMLFVLRVNVSASASARIVPGANTQSIQPIFDARVAELLVRPLQPVRAGAVLMQLDTTALKSERQREQLNRDDLQAKLRLQQKLLEQTRVVERVPLSGPLTDDPFPSGADTLLVTTYRAFRDRVMALRSRHAALTRLLAGVSDRDAQLQLAVNAFDSRLDAMRKLAQGGYVARIDLLREEENNRRLRGDRLDIVSRRNEVQSQIDATLTDLNSTFSGLRQQSEERMSDLRLRIGQSDALLTKLEYDLMHGSLTAPIDGVVQDLRVPGPGAVVRAGDVVMRIAPLSGVLEVETLIDNRDIGFVRPGQRAVIKLDTYPFERYGVVPGRVDRVSTDSSFVDGRGWVYKAIVKPDAVQIRVDGDRHFLQVGETGQVDVIVRERRLIDFFLEPVFRYTSATFERR